MIVIAGVTRLSTDKVIRDNSGKCKLTKAELTLLAAFHKHDHEYSFHICPDHGLHARLKSIEYTGCSTCKTMCHALTKENLETLKKQLK